MNGIEIIFRTLGWKNFAGRLYITHPFEILYGIATDHHPMNSLPSRKYTAGVAGASPLGKHDNDARDRVRPTQKIPQVAYASI